MASISTFNNNNNINLEKNHYYQQQSNNDSVHPLSSVTNTNSNNSSSVLDYLPTLDDVLYRHSQPPVCLYNYYIVLRDRLELETLLDFWLDVAQADILYKRYIKYSTRKASTTTTNRIQQPKPSISSSMLTYNALATAQRRSSRTSDILTHMLLLHPRASIANTMCSNTTTASNRKPPPTQHEMMETVERIYLRYIVSSAEKELNGLPHHIRESISQYFIHHTLSSTTKEVLDNPIIFAQAKNYVHQILQSTFPLFLRYKVFMNLTLPQQIGRLALGLIFLLIGFSVEFSLIFLDVHPWQKRLWVRLKCCLFFFPHILTLFIGYLTNCIRCILGSHFNHWY